MIHKIAMLAGFLVLCLAFPSIGRPASAQTLPSPPNVQKDIVYAASANPASPLKLDLYLPPADAIKTGQKIPVLVRISRQREAPAGPAKELLAKGCALVYAAYLPDDAARTLTFNPFPADLFAAKAAIRWVRGNAGAQHFDADRIGVWGAGDGATLAALLAVTADQKDLNGTLGDFPNESSAVRTACLFSGTTDWRYAELYGDETVNFPGSPAYQLFTGNPKDFPEAARRASAVTYIRPNSPPVLMVTLASDSNRAMHLIFAETLRRAGVPSALYEEPPGSGAGLGGRAVDEARLDRTILEFFGDTLLGKTAPTTLSVDEEITQLVKAGLYKQARRIIEEQVELAPPGGRAPWLKRVREIADKQTEAAFKEITAAQKAYRQQHPDGPNPTWTSREVLTDPEHIGEYHLVATPTALEYEARANALRHAELLNQLIQEKDSPGAEREAALLRTLAANKQADAGIAEEFLNRFAEVRSHGDQAWPSGIKPVVFALASGRDLYGFWFTMRINDYTERFRYIPPGKFAMGSPRDEWSRLPDEPILEPTEIKQGFWLADAPVTREIWDSVMHPGGAHSGDEGPATSPAAPGSAPVFKGPKLPAINLSYAHAVNFLDKLAIDARLPTSAEWEYACRAGSSEMYPVTGRLSDSSWFWDEAAAPPGSSPEIRILSELEADRTRVPRSTHAVKEKLPNRFGLYDMQGNVWEWCAGSSPDKPRDFHLARGGSWISLPQSCRAARVAWFPIEQEAWNLGLRIMIPAQSNP